jgi:uncharacterized protein
MTGRFVLRKSGAQFYFTLRAAGDHEVILTSERYTSKTSALAGIEAIRANAAAATLDDETRTQGRGAEVG